MRTFASFLALTLSLLFPAWAAEPAPPSRDSIQFRNGDTLYGSFRSLNSTNGLVLHRADALEPLEFNPEFVSELTLTQRESGPTNILSPCFVHLTNGDQFEASLLSYDGVKVEVDTWFAGKLTIPNETVAMILPVNNTRRVVFQGPGDLSGWTMGKVNALAAGADGGVWHLINDALYANKSASIARDVNLPEVASLQFDLEWRGFFHIAVALYTQYLHPVNLANKETEPNFGGFYSLQINPFAANLLPVRQHDPLRYLGQAPLQTLGQKTSAHFDIRVDKHKKIIALLIDGVLVRQWAESAEETFAGSGTAIRFVHQGQGTVKLSNIRVLEWDGTFEETPSLTPNKSQDLARLRNGDRVFGDVRSIDDGKMVIHSTGSTLNIPLARVKQIEFVAAKPHPINPTPTTIRAYFWNGGRLTLDLQSIQDGKIYATSPAFGPATLQLPAFGRLVFDLNLPEPRSLN